MRRGELADLIAFMAVAENLSFRAAAVRLGITPSALSHTVRQLEERLGVRLLHRTTRSVSLTDSGRRLLERLRPAIAEITGALDDLNGERSRPFGRLRIYSTHLAAAAVIAPVWARFLSTYPDVDLELILDEASIDIVAGGFDAGIGSKDRAAADMVAVRVMAPMKVAVVGAPAYFTRRPRPRTPDDLVRHECIQYRRSPNESPVRVAVRTVRPVAAHLGDGSADGQRPPDVCPRRRRWPGHRLHGRAAGGAFPALGPAGARARRLVAML
jgi:DNA-binding transcriptional LysR family regulator